MVVSTTEPKFVLAVHEKFPIVPAPRLEAIWNSFIEARWMENISDIIESWVFNRNLRCYQKGAAKKEPEVCVGFLPLPAQSPSPLPPTPGGDQIDFLSFFSWHYFPVPWPGHICSWTRGNITPWSICSAAIIAWKHLRTQQLVPKIDKKLLSPDPKLLPSSLGGQVDLLNLDFWWVWNRNY